MFLNDGLLEQARIEPYESGTSTEEYTDCMKSVTDATGGAVYCGTDMTQRIQTFENVLRAQSGNLYTRDGELCFTKDELRDFWDSGADARDGVTVPQQRLEEIFPKSRFGANLTASEASWSNFLGGYLADLRCRQRDARRAADRRARLEGSLPAGRPADGDLREDRAPRGGRPLARLRREQRGGRRDLRHDPRFPASETKLAGTTLEGIDAQVADYLESVADRIGEAPPVPVVGYGSLEQTFWDLGKSDRPRGAQRG